MTMSGENMPELSFKAKEFGYTYQLAVPHRPLAPDDGLARDRPIALSADQELQ